MNFVFRYIPHAGYILILLLLFSLKDIPAQQETKFELASINFEGNLSFPDEELKAVMQSNENPFWFWRLLNSFTPLGSPPNYFDSSSISIDIISLKSFYAVEGFFKTEINYKYEIDSSSKSVDLTYIIFEKSFSRVNEMNVIGLEKLDLVESLMPTVDQLLEYPKGERYRQERLQNNYNGLITFLKNNGYMLAAYDSTVIDIDTIKNEVNLFSYFTLDTKYAYNKIIIEKDGEGKNLVSDTLIQYVSNINPGDLYKELEISKSRVRLARTGLFNSINLKVDTSEIEGNRIPLHIAGNIGSLNELSPEVFADNELNTFNGGVGASYVRKNFLGDARKLTLRSRLRINDVPNVSFSSSEAFDKTFQSEIDLSAIVEQPFLFSRRIAGRLEAYMKSYRISLVDYLNFGTTFTATVEQPSYTFVNLFNPYLRIDRLTFDTPQLEFEGDTISISSRTFTTSLGAEVGSTNTDDFFYPTEGRTISLITEFAASDVNASLTNVNSGESTLIDSLGFYVKSQLTFAFYFGLSKDNWTVLGIKAKTGYIKMISGGEPLVSPNQTFFAGGSNSVRGWRARELIPSVRLDDLFPPSINEQFRIRGGIFLLEGSFEYRRKFEDYIGAALFIDYGNTWNTFTDFKFDEIAVAVGTGLRYYSPIAPFRIDFGFKFYDPDDGKLIFDKAFFKTIVFHFGIGEAF
jgi:outer membrane protein assembly factor BamA